MVILYILTKMSNITECMDKLKLIIKILSLFHKNCLLIK